MPLLVPNLDDRQFTDLVNELEARIPRYLPEWTNRNTSDPGITLIELFSWLSEILIYRMNQVPNKNYIAFLQLIGVKQKPAVPATVDLTFTLSNPPAGPVVIPAGTQVAASAQTPPPSVNTPPTLPTTPAPPTIFETNEPLIALGNALKHIQVFDGVSFTEYTQQNNIPGDHFPAFGPTAKPGSYLMLGFDANMPFPVVELNLTFVLWVDTTQIQPFSSETSKDPALPQATLAWEYWTGFNWKRLAILKDETNSLLRAGHFYFLGPMDIVAATLGAVTENANWLRIRLISSQYEVLPEISAILPNTVAATAVTTVRDEVLGSSNGQGNQLFTVANIPIYANDPMSDEALLNFIAANPCNPTDEQQQQIDLKIQQMELAKGFLLEVDEGLGSQPWIEIPDFYAATDDDPVYTLDRTSGLVTFGKRIPVAGTNNIVVRYYRFGGGLASNLPAGAITDLQTPVAGIDSVTNNNPSTGGDDEESLADTEARAPAELKARDRAVTSEDFEFLAMQAPGTRVRRAHALPLYHPEFPTVQVPGVVTVVVIPDSEDPKPLPSDSTLASVAHYLDQRRLLTTELFIAPPQYVQIRVNLIVEARPGTDPAQLQIAIVSALNAYLNPLTGADDQQGWPMGGTVIYSSVYRVVLQVTGVQSIDLLQIFSDGNLQPAFQNVAIPSDHLVYSDGHDVQVRFPVA